MPNTREKLMRLLCDALEDGCIGHCNYPPCYQVERATNHLIANGVTVQEWISVKDRLPKRFVYVLVMTDFGEAAVARLKGNGRWYIGWDNDQYAGITHWMPLPQPPKGE